MDSPAPAVSDTAVPPAAPAVSSANFLPIGDLFKKSWVTFKRSWLNLFFLNLSLIAVAFAAALVIAIIAAIAFGPQLMSLIQNTFSINIQNSFNSNALPALNPAQFILPGVLLLVLFVVLAVIGSAVQIAQITIVADTEAKKIGDHVRAALPLVVPLFLTGVMAQFIVGGSFFVFMIPAIILSVLFSLVGFEVVLGRKSYLNALKGSYAIISQHFPDIFIRTLAMWGIFIGIMLLPALLTQVNESLGTSVSMVTTLLNPLVGWFSLAYIVELYKEAKAKTDWSKEPGMTWVWIVTILGWLLAIFWGVVFFGLVVPKLAPIASEASRQETRQTLDTYEAWQDNEISGWQLGP